MESLKAKTRYALLAALNLAERYDGDNPTKLQEIAVSTGIPDKYLVHILISLKKRALVNSSRGSKGGYWLMRRPELITMAEVVDAVEPRQQVEPPPETEHDRLVVELWNQALNRMQGYLAGITLADAMAMVES